MSKLIIISIFFVIILSIGGCGRNPFVDISNMNKNTGRMANEFEHDRKYMEGVNSEIKRIADGISNFQLFLTTLEKFFNTLMANFNKVDSSKAEIPNSIKDTDLENIKIPSLGATPTPGNNSNSNSNNNTSNNDPSKNDEFNF